MNKATKDLSELLQGSYCKTILIGGKVYVMKAPSIKVITRAAKHLSLVSVSKDFTISEIMQAVSEHSENIAKGLSMKAPSIKVITRAAKHLSLVSVSKDFTISEIMQAVSEHSENIAKGLSYLVVGDIDDYEARSEEVYEAMISGTHEELYTAFLVAFELIAGRDFFGLCQLAMELAQMITKPRS
uniref:hypothetical protein n=1 Tax=Parabacteroides pacaensis TaxID=2086575 RepID=UPI000D1111AD